MAGDWLKFEKSTLDKPEVFEMAGILGIDPDAVVGKLLRVWNWFDDQSRDGHAPVTVLSLLDRYTGVTGFVSAMKSVGWMLEENGLLILPNFERHNGTPAKSRALAKTRKQKSRSCHAECHAPSVTKTGPEKRREEKSKEPPLSPKGEIDKKAGSIPTNPQAIRIAELYRRRPTTPWSAKEIRAFRALGTIDPSDLDAVCRYTESERSKGDEGCHRRDLLTFLNNFTGELDRARQKQSPVKEQITFID
jgi:hypothetical protein